MIVISKGPTNLVGYCKYAFICVEDNRLVTHWDKADKYKLGELLPYGKN